MPSLLEIAGLVLPLMVGMSVGYFMRNREHLNISKVTSVMILILVFSLGFSIGSNSQLLTVLPKVGLNAIVLLFMAIIFSIFFVKITEKLVKI
ncbi:MAG: LysO family transporter [Candidatus Bathyarchaeia archaeon]